MSDRDPIRGAFYAGWDAGWDCTGEGKNGEYTSPHYTQASYERERGEAYAQWAKAPDPDENRRQVEALAAVLALRWKQTRSGEESTRPQWEAVATLAYELGARVR